MGIGQLRMNPIAAAQALIGCAIAFVLGLLCGAVPAYFVGKAHEAEKKGLQVGALTTSVDSCTAAAKETKKVVADEATAGKDREARITAAIADGARIAAAANRARSTTLATPIRGSDECERVKNAVEDHFWGAKK
jgi:hypothetical protein